MSTPVFPIQWYSSAVRTAVQQASVSRSAFTPRAQVIDWQSGYWTYDITLGTLYGREARRCEGFLAGLRGPATPFLLEDDTLVHAADATGPHPGPIVSGADQRGFRLVTSGWLASTLTLRTGDFFNYGSGSSTRLHVVTEDAVSDASGNANLKIWPQLRDSPIDGAALELAAPKALLRLARSVPVGLSAGTAFSMSFSCVEAV